MTDRLSVVAVRHAKPGRHGDGAGLLLDVKPGGNAYWVLRYMLAGKRRDMGLGSARGPGAITLADARDRATAARRLAKDGIDPIEQRDEKQAAAKLAVATLKARSTTFRDIALQYVAAHGASWRNTKHRAQWESTLRKYVYPRFGDLPVSDVEREHVTGALQAIWNTKPETASRVRGRIEAVLDYARVLGWRHGENPALWKGNLAHVLPSRSKLAPVKHHAALPWIEMAGFMADLNKRVGVSARALEFTILTAARSGEVRGMTWAEVDLDAQIWVVPGSRMKAAREHRVPLSNSALSVLEAIRPDPARVSGFVFPSPSRPGAPLSDMTLTAVLRRMMRSDLTTHGFRSTFRDWCAEMTAYPREVAEAALAHTVRDKVEAAYRRGDVLEKRRQLMTDWADFCSRVDRREGDDVRSVTAASPNA
jgi:integrase